MNTADTLPAGNGELRAMLPALAQMLKQRQTEPYTPIGKALAALGITPRIEDVGGTECLVIPVAELVDKEWRHLTGGLQQQGTR